MIEPLQLAAANLDLGWPDEPHLILWQAATILREHRGDGHMAAALTAGFDPCELLVSFASIGAVAPEVLASRGWTADEWQAALDRLTARGWTTSGGTATPAGAEARAALETRTDELAVAPWLSLGPAAARFAQLAGPLAARVANSGLLPRTSTLALR
ncbi:SCO6745 family protein [Actinoplanes derwentensis]|uniref:SCO6745 family protein n=1 Tax=Actinoplanes derwentensis TaxID=113562 RepID=UPI000B83BA0E|nr:hypothetical protein [Actinoplanes derwentensis]